MAKIKKIMKFGGSSLGSPKLVRKSAEIIKREAKEGNVAVVVSAFQGVTNELLALARLAVAKQILRERFSEFENRLEGLKIRHLKVARQLVKDRTGQRQVIEYIENLFKELDLVLRKIRKSQKVSNKNFDLVGSFGERLSAYIVAASIRGAYFVDARELVKTDDNYVNAAVDFQKTNRRIQNYFKNRKSISVITGFLGSTKKGETTTLGRGGSDYTAAIFGAALDVKVVEIWTDVNGVMSADPRFVKSSEVLPEISYEEAIEMAYFGAKVIHPATMLPAIKKKIPIWIKNTFKPTNLGTLISSKANNDHLIKGITAIDSIALIIIGGVSLAGIPGSAARVFKAIARKKVNVILISQASSEHTICFGIRSKELKAALGALKREFNKEIKSGRVGINVIKDQAIIAVVGEGMRGIPGIAGNLFSALGNESVSITAIAQGGSERNISFVVNQSNKIKALNIIHQEFFEGGSRKVFLAGTGTVGSVLLDQISNFRKSHFRKLDISICGIINGKKMLLSESGIKLNNWKNKLDRGEDGNFAKWLREIKNYPFVNKIFVDCTASDQIAKKYIEIADSGFNIVTPNKKFNTLSMKEYKKLRKTVAERKNQFLYETNVGAGLPVISTIEGLIKSGDRIIKIEGIFSGTLSFIFNNFVGKKNFSEVVKTAKKLGYTEPDPREDLSGHDVGRKLLVLARELGLGMEMEDIRIENLVPEAIQRVKAPEEILNGLREYDDYFKKILEKAYNQNKVLRYVAKLERGRASASLQAVSLNNPLAGTRGADNIFAIYTKRYNERPLVIQGPGAGAEVTAAGVLADILRI